MKDVKSLFPRTMACMYAWSGRHNLLMQFSPRAAQKNFDLVTTHNDHPSYVKHDLGRTYVFFTLQRFPNLWLEPCSSKTFPVFGWSLAPPNIPRIWLEPCSSMPFSTHAAAAQMKKKSMCQLFMHGHSGTQQHSVNSLA